MLNKIAVTFTVSSLQEQAAWLAGQLQLPVVEITEQGYEYLLVYTECYLELRPVNQPALGAIHVDFLTGKSGYRRSHTFIKNELLAKAVGLKSNQPLTVIDATAGLGRDSFILACLGCDVTLLERSPVIAALLEDGLARLFAVKEASEKLTLALIQDDALRYLQSLDKDHYPDIIYLDPMYPHRTKSALVKKEMRVVRAFAGDDQDAQMLCELAMQRARKRVVVKRPIQAPLLSEKMPHYNYKGKQHRFDVYDCRRS